MSIRNQCIEDFSAAIKHLDYSYKKILKMNLAAALDDEEMLETLESFASRFARASDITVNKYFRTLAIERDPGYRGSVIDLLNDSEKFSIIDSAKTWERIRQLRNIAAHEHQSKDLLGLYQELIRLAPYILSLSGKL